MFALIWNTHTSDNRGSFFLKTKIWVSVGLEQEGAG